jgi:hypothetical protein
MLVALSFEEEEARRRVVSFETILQSYLTWLKV